MNKFKIALAAVAATGAALVAAPEPAKAGGIGFSVGFGSPGYYGGGWGHGGGWGYGYRPVSYGYGPGWGYGYRRPFVRKVVVVQRPYYPAHYHRRVVKRVVYGGYPAYYRRPVVKRVVYGGYPAYYHRPIVRRVAFRPYPGFYGHHRGFYGRPHHVRFVSYGHRGRFGGGWGHHRRSW